MSTREIARDHWKSFCDGFSQQHRGWLVTIMVTAADREEQMVIAHDLRLSGVIYDDAEDSLLYLVGRTPESHVTHTVDHPRRLWVEQQDEGLVSALDVEDAGGRITELRFRTTLPADMLNGVLSGAP
ncbi:MAG TPA: DUF5335 family protein [Chloroflexi bacterium]|jgi:hypothetical protein|nr:DUF5335 family protein [Chloroflexota bacterium]